MFRPCSYCCVTVSWNASRRQPHSSDIYRFSDDCFGWESVITLANLFRNTWKNSHESGNATVPAWPYLSPFDAPLVGGWGWWRKAPLKARMGWSDHGGIMIWFSCVITMHHDYFMTRPRIGLYARLFMLAYFNPQWISANHKGKPRLQSFTSFVEFHTQCRPTLH